MILNYADLWLLDYLRNNFNRFDNLRSYCRLLVSDVVHDLCSSYSSFNRLITLIDLYSRNVTYYFCTQIMVNVGLNSNKKHKESIFIQ